MPTTERSCRALCAPAASLRPAPAALAALAGLVVAAACTDLAGPEPPPSGSSAVEVSAATTGQDVDADGYTAVLAGGVSQDLAANDTVTFADIAADTYQVELTEVADNCTVQGDNPRSVTVAAGDTAATTFDVACTNIQEIAFVSIRGGTNRDVFVQNLSTGLAREVSQNQSQTDSLPRWSPDGSRIAFVSSRTPEDHDIWVVNADGSNLRVLADSPDLDGDPRWSPDGSRIAFVSDRLTNEREIWVVNADGSNLRQLTSGFGENYSPRWSPDGSQIAFVSDRTGDEEIFTMAADGSNQLNRSQNFNDDTDPQWSPDGSTIAFVSDRTNDAEIFAMAPDGSDQRNLSQNFNEDVFPRWSPDGNRLAFVSDRTNDEEIWVMDADGADPQNVTQNSPGQDIEPDWRP